MIIGAAIRGKGSNNQGPFQQQQQEQINDEGDDDAVLLRINEVDDEEGGDAIERDMEGQSCCDRDQEKKW